MSKSNQKKDDELVEELRLIKDEHIEKALDHLRQCEIDIQTYLADFVASICDVEKEQMLSDCNTLCVAQARGLYWYARRYMNNDTFERIARQTNHINGKAFTEQGVAARVYKMSQLIDSEPLWRNRWSILKRIINTKYDDKEKDTDNVVVIQIPKGMREKFKIEIKEK